MEPNDQSSSPEVPQGKGGSFRTTLHNLAQRYLPDWVTLRSEEMVRVDQEQALNTAKQSRGWPDNDKTAV